MAIMKAVRCMSWFYSDGTTNSYTIKLAQGGDPYWVGEAQEGNVRGSTLHNWFALSTDNAAPKGVKMVTGAVSIGLSVPNSIVTVTIDPKPNGTLQEVVFDLLFA